MGETPTRETPFRLTYGIEAVIPVEVGVTSIRRKVFNEESNDDHLRINLDFLDESKRKSFHQNDKVSAEDGRLLQ